VLVILSISLPIIKKACISTQRKKLNLYLICSAVCIVYGLLGGIISGFALNYDFLATIAISTGVIMLSSFIALAVSYRHISLFFLEINQITPNKYKTMDTTITPGSAPDSSKSVHSNKILFKGIITGALILVMLIPTIFISNLVRERQARQSQVANEVSDKWAQAQTLTGPYIYLPYKIITADKDKKVTEQLSHLIIIPDNLIIDGQISHELRLRSIYKVLLYKAASNSSGNFQFQIPKEIDSSLVQWQNAKICYGLSDFKGIEERLVVNFKGSDYKLSPGLPINDLNEK
jgi:inner membrane protein